ncbi:MAG: type II secretion system F family protein [Candidatus Hydrothermarchaeales archaeon]
MQIIWGFSLTSFLILGAITLTQYIPTLEYAFDPGRTTEKNPLGLGEIAPPVLGLFDITDMTLLTLLAVLLPTSIAYTMDSRWRNAIDEYLPSLLREISDAQKTGLPLPRAITQASRRQYGPLTEELKKMASKISWGISFEEALTAFAENADTPMVQRTTLLILEAERSGGAIEDVFDAAHGHVSELLSLKKERLDSMKPYTFIIIMAFLVFAMVVIILISTFFVMIATEVAPATAEAGVAGGTALPFALAGLQLIFYHLLIIEGTLGGIIAGKMGRGNTKAGLLFSTIMVIAGDVLFKLAVITFGYHSV